MVIITILVKRALGFTSLQAGIAKKNLNRSVNENLANALRCKPPSTNMKSNCRGTEARTCCSLFHGEIIFVSSRSTAFHSICHYSVQFTAY